MNAPKIVVFSCAHAGHSALNAAGNARLNYPAALLPLKVSCLAAVSPAAILQAFEKGAAGVLLLGCPEEECRHAAGRALAGETFARTRELAALLGLGAEQLVLARLPFHSEEAFAETVRQFVENLNTGESQ